MKQECIAVAIDQKGNKIDVINVKKETSSQFELKNKQKKEASTPL